MSERSGRRITAAEEVATVAALTHEGEGVVRAGKTVFITGALPGETVRFRRVRSHRQHDDGELLEILQRSPQRTEPRCAHFGVCGGCALQHLSPQAQIEIKQAQLQDNLQRVARVSPAQWLAPLRGPDWQYRRRARLGAKFVIRKDRVVVGFRERLAPYVAEVRRCEVLAAPVGELIEPLARLLTGLDIRQRLPQIEVAVADNAVALVLRVLDPPTERDLQRLREFAAAHSVQFHLQSGGLDSVRPLDADAAGDALHYELAQTGLRLQFAPTDFIQINRAINEQLVARAVELLELTPRSRVLDLFCGLGNFTLPLARHAASVVGVEGDAALVQRARHNAAANAIANAAFHVADLAQEPGPGAPWLGEYSHVLLDPPRAGAGAMLRSIARLAPRRLLYISCHPGSLARDIGVLVHEHGMELLSAGVLDMFPHTAHVESIAVLEPGARGSRME